MPDKEHLGDIHRFGLDNPFPPRPVLPTPFIGKARARFKRGVVVRGSTTGAVTGLYGLLSSARGGAPESIASDFLRQNQDVLGIDPATLTLSVKKQSAGVQHVLFQQMLNGLPVEFSRVKVHLSKRGEVIGLASGYRHNLNISPNPTISEQQAAGTVAAELGRPVNVAGTLVYLPVYATGQIRLAWKFHVVGNYAIWNYYIDAQTGAVLFRYNTLSMATTGNISANVYAIDPSTTPTPIVAPLPNTKLFVFGDLAPILTDASGNFSSGSTGKIVTSLQGKFVSVANAAQPSAHYDNGGGIFCPAPTPVASPSPYPQGTAQPNSVVFTATVITPVFSSGPCSVGPVVKLLPHFSTFQVGLFDPTAGIGEDDQVQVLDASNVPLASYIGNKGAFTSAGVMGPNPSYKVNLLAAPGDSQPGFTIDNSTGLVLTAPTPNGPGNVFPTTATNVIWYSTMTADSTEDEIMVYYHLNVMHDYFANGVDVSGAADLSQPFPAMTRLGPGFANAFFDPDIGSISFGDAPIANVNGTNNGAFAVDATISHHEYTHLVVSKIFPIFNFGQSGAMSEGIADYFATSSLNDSHMGALVGGSFTSEGSLRELDCSGNPALCIIFPSSTTTLGTWTGEIHQDSLPLSQALWEIRGLAGQTCADGLVFQSLFFFPESFQEVMDAMVQVDAQGLVAACGGAGAQRNTIIAQMNHHGIGALPVGVDAYEPNDGPDTATNISTMTSVIANIYPAADQDFYTFGAAAGPMSFLLNLPPNGVVFASFMGYSMTLLDSQLHVVAEAIPTLANPTPGGGCPNGSTVDQMCQSSVPSVRLNYNAPSAGQYYLLVSAGPTDDGSTSNANSLSPYSLLFSYVKPGVLSSGIVQAVFDNDTISFKVNIQQFGGGSTFFQFAFAQLRDQNQQILPQTATNGVAPFLTVVGSPVVSGGVMTGQVRLTPGFASRFPSAGTVYLEVFAYNVLQNSNQTFGVPGFPGVSQSLGVSNAVNLTTDSSGLTAYNNIIVNPGTARNATLKWAISSGGHVTLKVYSMSGVLVRTLVDGDYPPGKGAIDWDARNSAGNIVASGIYIVHLEGPSISASEKVIVVK